MKITKLEHACLDITNNESRLVVDPGVWTNPLASYEGISLLVITHVHPDHCDPEKVQAIVEANPELQIFSTEQVAEKLQDTAKVTVPEIGKLYEAGGFQFEFFGGQHAKIMDTYPQDQNYGVLVNEALYYPGDSFTLCPKPHKVTAVPVFAPWLKFSETAEFVQNDTANEIFPTHNNIANQNGHDLIERMLSTVTQQKSLHNLTPGDSIEV